MNEAVEMHAKIVFMLVVKNPVILIPGAKASLVSSSLCVVLIIALSSDRSPSLELKLP